MSAHEALARELHAMTDGLDGEGTATWPDPQQREVYALAVEEVAGAILADPAPLLAALVESGVLTEEGAMPNAVGAIRGLGALRRYVTDWTEVGKW